MIAPRPMHSRADIGLGDGAHAGVNDARLDFVGRQLLMAPAMASTEPCTSPLTTSGNSWLPVSCSWVIICSSEPRRTALARSRLVAGLPLAVLGDLTGAAFILDHRKAVAGCGVP
jgi:hypothetical protein